MGRYNVGVHMKSQKEKRAKVIENNRKIEELDTEIKLLDGEIQKKKKVLEAKRVQSKRLDSQIAKEVNEIEELGEIGKELGGRKRGRRSSVGETNYVDDKLNIGQTTAKKRRRQTFEAAKDIHGGRKERYKWA